MGDGVKGGGSERELSVRGEEGDGVEFLEGAFGGEVGFRGASEEEKGEGVDVRVSDLCRMRDVSQLSS